MEKRLKVLLLFICLTVSSVGIFGQNKPNIILIMADDLGIGDVRYTGFNQYIETPNLDAMSKNGIRFDRFYSQSPVCSPTRGSCLTGRHPFRYGIFEANVGHLRPNEITLPQILQDAGYATAHFGKWHLGALLSPELDNSYRMQAANPLEMGYDFFYGTQNSVPTYDPNIDHTAAGYDPINSSSKTLFVNTDGTIKSEYLKDGNVIQDVHNYVTTVEKAGTKELTLVTHMLEGDDSKVIMDEAIPWIEAHQNESFFATIWFHTPHKDLVASPEMKAYYENKYPSLLSEGQLNLYGAVTDMDKQIGLLMDKLKELGIAENTMVWFTSDNGPVSADNGRTGVFKGEKRHLLEAGVRVPGILVWPQQIETPRISDDVVVTSDYLPTILDVLDIPMHDYQIDGQSISSLIEGDDFKRLNPLCFQSHGNIVCMNEDYKLIRPGFSSTFKNLYEADVSYDIKEWLLFDMQKDSTENKNIYASHEAIALDLKSHLAQWMEDVNQSYLGNDYSIVDYVPTQGVDSYRFLGGYTGTSINYEKSDARLGAIYINGKAIKNFISYDVNHHDEAKKVEPVIKGHYDAANYQFSTHYNVQLLNNEMPEIVANTLAAGATVLSITEPVNLLGNREERTASIIVESQDQNETLEYTIEFSILDDSSNAFLKSISYGSLSIDDFSVETNTYHVYVPDWTNAADIAVSAEAMVNGATVVITHAVKTGNAKESKRTSAILVTSVDGLQQEEYKVIFQWESESTDLLTANTRLADLQVNGITVPDFSPYSATYFMEWPEGETEVTVTGIAADNYAIVNSETLQVNNGSQSERTATIEVASSNGNTTYEYHVIFGEEVTTSIGEEEALKLSLYPNPTENTVSVESNLELKDYYLFDRLGRQLRPRFTGRGQLDVSNLNRGVYYITVHPLNTGGFHTLKFIKK